MLKRWFNGFREKLYENIVRIALEQYMPYHATNMLAGVSAWERLNSEEFRLFILKDSAEISPVYNDLMKLFQQTFDYAKSQISAIRGILMQVRDGDLELCDGVICSEDGIIVIPDGTNKIALDVEGDAYDDLIAIIRQLSNELSEYSQSERVRSYIKVLTSNPKISVYFLKVGYRRGERYVPFYHFHITVCSNIQGRHWCLKFALMQNLRCKDRNMQTERTPFSVAVEPRGATPQEQRTEGISIKLPYSQGIGFMWPFLREECEGLVKN